MTNGLNATYINHMGDDLTVVNNARVSFAKETEWMPSGAPNDYDGVIYQNIDGKPVNLSRGDAGLVRYLADGMRTKDLDAFLSDVCSKADAINYGFGGSDVEALWKQLKKFRRTPLHWVPFANGCNIQFHIEAPIPIMRQVFKHKVGAVESEVSRRYVTDTPTIFQPDWRLAAENVKQGSSDETFSPSPMFVPMPVAMDGQITQAVIPIDYRILTELSVRYYEFLTKTENACPEQARFILPQGAVTEARISNSLYGWANFYNARSDVDHAQREVAKIAEDVANVCSALFPVSWKALTE